jgi:predicted MFS family arabinose efflux permease
VTSSPPIPRAERFLVFTVGAVQFVNMLEFVLVMPLGPDFARDLCIPTAHIGWVGGSYTAAAAVAGIAASWFLDRFDRRSALVTALVGLVLGTVAAAMATGLTSLMAARVAAGLFGGPATSLSLSIVADVVPPARRGRAVGAVLGSFAIASVIGVPLGLELARFATWRAPLFAVAGLGFVVATLAWRALPPLRIHLDTKHVLPPPAGRMLFRRETLLSFAALATHTMAAFSLIPNIATYVQLNRGWPRSRLGLLYLAGGALTFFAMRLAGRLTDRFGPARVCLGGAAAFAAVLWFGFIRPADAFPVPLVFVGFMLGMTFRGIPLNTLVTRVPHGSERARFLSAQSAVQHIASSGGAMAAAAVLRSAPDGRLIGIERVAGGALVLSLALPVILAFLEGKVARRERETGEY